MGNWMYDNEFEKYLKEQADQHRMYPSDPVWRNIQHEIHGYKKWPALTFISILIISALVVSTVVLKPHTQQRAATPANTTNKVNEKSAANTAAENQKKYNEHLLAENITQQTIKDVIQTVHEKQSGETLVISTPHAPSSIINNSTDNNNSSAAANSTVSQELTQSADIKEQSIASSKPENDKREILSPSFFLRDDLNINSDELSKEHYNTNYHFTFSNTSNSLTDDNISSAFSFSLSRKNSTSSIINLSNPSKFDFQFYAAPSISYRRLVDDAHGQLAHSYISAIPLDANYSIDVNRIIQHRSSAGYEVGFGVGYNLSKNFAVRSGFQFNMRQYNINAYVHSTEPTSISLVENGSNGVWNTISAFRNISGSTPIVLKNRYYEISLPLGVDWRPINKKFAWGFAASIQPTYTFDKEPFIISANFKNYTDGSKLMRNWNLNTSFETYLGYNTGQYRWQIGPQVRYQLLPTMNNSYPIREYLLDYGIKIGLIRSLK